MHPFHVQPVVPIGGKMALTGRTAVLRFAGVRFDVQFELFRIAAHAVADVTAIGVAFALVLEHVHPQSIGLRETVSAQVAHYHLVFEVASLVQLQSLRRYQYLIAHRALEPALVDVDIDHMALQGDPEVEFFAADVALVVPWKVGMVLLLWSTVSHQVRGQLLPSGESLAAEITHVVFGVRVDSL